MYEDNYFREDYQCSPIHLALERGHYKAVKALLKYNKTDLNLKSEYHDAWTSGLPIDMAIDTNDIRIVKAVLPSIKKIDNSTVRQAVWLATTSGQGHSVEIMKMLLPYSDKNFQLNEFSEGSSLTLLELSAKSGKLNTIKAMTTYDEYSKTFCKSPYIPYSRPTENNISFGPPFNAFMPIYLAIKNEHFEVAKYLIGCKSLEEDVKPNDPDRFGRYNGKTPIHMAAEKGHVETVKLLMATTEDGFLEFSTE